VRRLEQPAEAIEHNSQAPGTSSQPPGALVLALLGGGAHLRLDVLDQALAG
jgi:MYXO-CTERM domain-containing protein